VHRSAAFLGAVVVAVAAAGHAAGARADTVARLVPPSRLACELSALGPTMNELMGREVLVDEAPLEIRVAVVEHGERRAARMELVEAGRVHGVRTIEAASCQELVAAMGVVLSLAMRDRDALTANTSSARDTRDAGDVSPPGMRVIEGALHAIGGAAGDDWQLGLAPSARLRLGARSAAFEVELRAPDETVAGEGSLRVTSLAAALTPCLHRGSVAACAVLAGGWTRAQSRGLFDPRDVRVPLLAGGLRAEWQPFAVGRFALRARGEVRANAYQAEFLVDQMPAWTARRWEAWLGLGVVAQIP
jgi:hypothetical protein